MQADPTPECYANRIACVESPKKSSSLWGRASKQVALVVADFERDVLQAASDGTQAHGKLRLMAGMLLHGEDAPVVGHRRGREPPRFAAFSSGCFVGRGHSTNGLNRKIGRKAESRPKLGVAELLKANLVGRVVFDGNPKSVVAGFRKHLHRFAECLPLLWRSFKSALHDLNEIHQDDYSNSGGEYKPLGGCRQFLPVPRGTPRLNYVDTAGVCCYNLLRLFDLRRSDF